MEGGMTALPGPVAKDTPVVVGQKGTGGLSVLRPDSWAIGSSGREAFV